MTITPDSVQQLLDSENFGERIRGVNQLRQIDPQVAFEMLKPLVADANARIRYAAVSLFDTLGGEDLATSLELLRDRLFNDSEVDVQAAAADALGGLKLVEAFDDLEQLYRQSSEWLIQLSIVATLGELGHPRSFDLLQEALASDNDLVVISAISSLGELGDSRAVSLLLPFVNHEDWQMRYRLAQALGHLGGAEAQATLAKLAGDLHEQVAQEAKRNLERVIN
jgi:HEAT repeat protein